MDILKRNNIKIFGTGGRTLLFAHGFIGDQTLWRLVAPAFTQDYRVVLFDYVGVGRSDPKAYDNQRYSRLEGYAQDVVEICDALSLRDVIFVGHSVSCMIGLIAAISHPRYFDKMVFVGPSPCYINEPNYFGGFDRNQVDEFMNKMQHDYSGWARETATMVTDAPGKPELSQELMDGLMSRDQRMARDFACVTFFSDYRRELLKLNLQTLIIQCSDDKMAPLQVGDYLHAHLANSSLSVLQSKGHFPQLSVPKEVVRVIKDFLV